MIRDPALSGIHTTPVGPLHLDPPSLHHYSADGRARGLAHATATAVAEQPAGRGPTAPLLVLTVLVALVAIGVAAIVGITLRLKRTGAVRPWYRFVPLLVTGGAVVSLAAATVPTTPPRGHRLELPVSTAPAVSRSAPAPLITAAGQTVGPDLVVWSNFVRIEQDVIARTHTLTQANDQVNAFRASRPSAVPLVILLSRHQEALTIYQASLQGEYQFFVALAQDAQLRAALTQATVATPAARSVVAYNLDLVTSQLRQEQAIAAAASAAAAQALRPVRSSSRAPKFTAPVGGVVSQGFGATTLALEPSINYQGVFYEHFHTGIDITGALDTPIRAAPGRMILAGSSRDVAGRLVGYGNYIVIDHGGGFLTLYGHLDQEVVATGQAVQRGQEIGLLGTTGSSTGPHLHFEIRRNGIPVDPEALPGDAVRP